MPPRRATARTLVALLALATFIRGATAAAQERLPLLATASATTARPAPRRPESPPPEPCPPADAPRAPQFVLVGLDITPGPDTEQAFARRVADAAEEAGARITFFTNTQFFLLPPGTHRRRDLSPDEARWEDPDTRVLRRIAYARSVRDARGRVATARYLLARGHEIAGHGVHHERGGAWTEAQWRNELATFNRHQRELLELPEAVGFRAPYLQTGQGLHPAEAALGVLYDASRVVPLHVWPWRLGANGPWEIPVMSGRFGGCRAAVFDDALAQCGFSDEHLRRLLTEEFESRYRGNRAPFVLSAHDGLVESVYLPILRDVCARPEVRCVTFESLARYMSEHPALAAWGRRPSQFARAPSLPAEASPQLAQAP